MLFQGTLFVRLGKFGAVVDRAFSCAWTEQAILAEFGDEEVRTKDEQRLWSANRYREGASRGLNGLDAMYAAVLDRDCADVGELDRTCEWLQARGLAYVVYTSWSHGLPDKLHADTQRTGPFDCFRVVLPYSREVSKDEHRVMVPALFGHEVPADPAEYTREARGRYVVMPSGKERAAKPRGWDPCANRPAQGYYVPTPRAVLEVHPGAPVDPDAVLKRPTTARVTSRRERPYRPPSAGATGALGAIERALEDCGHTLGQESYAGWCRSRCPSCEDPSPSLTCRANGDGVDIRCHAGCGRQDVLGALGLTGDLYRPPSELEIELEEQLERQQPEEDEVSAEEAGTLLQQDIREAVASGEPTIVQYPAGTGKSYQVAPVIAELVLDGQRVVYSTQEHAVASQTRAYLPLAVRERSVHIHSPLLQVGDDPVCSRAEELHDQVFVFGKSLLGQICPRCPKRDSCEALAAAQERQRRLETASAIFVSHAGIGQVFGVDSQGRQKGHGVKLIVDEMPSTHQKVEVTQHQLEGLAEGAGLLSADPSVAKVVQELARAILAGETPGEVRWAPRGRRIGSAHELALEWGRLSVRDHARCTPKERPWLQAADALIRLYCRQDAEADVQGFEERGEGGLSAMLPDACHEALVQRKGVLLSATPMLAALPDFQLRARAVTDGAPVRRVMVLRESRGSRALLKNYYDDLEGARSRRDSLPGEEPGIPWPAVDSALERALREADRYEGGKVLFVTFKELADVLRSDGDRLCDGRIKVAHYGALRGKNDWQEGADDEVSVVYCFGTPRFGIYDTLEYLGLTGEAASQAWADYAAAELTQAEGRLRLPRRTKPCSVIVEGDVAPLSWHTGNISDVVPLAAERKDTATALLEAALLWRTQKEVAAELAVTGETVRVWKQPGRPPPASHHIHRLRELARPGFSEAMRLFSTMSPQRLERISETFTWLPLDGSCD